MISHKKFERFKKLEALANDKGATAGEKQAARIAMARIKPPLRVPPPLPKTVAELLAAGERAKMERKAKRAAMKVARANRPKIMGDH